MKDIIKKVLVGILAVVIVVGAAVYRFVFYNPDKPQEESTQPTVTDAAGTTYYAVTDPNTGSTMVVVTNENGEQFKAEFDGQTVGSTVAPVQDGEVNGSLPTNYTGPHIDVNANSTQPSSGSQGQSQSTTAPTTTTAPSGGNNQQNTTIPTTTKPTTTQAPASGNKVDIYQAVFKSGNFLMEVEDPDLGPVTMAMKGNKMYVDASMEGMSLKLVYNGDKKDNDNPDGTWYLILDGLKKYSKMPADMLGDMNVSELTKGIAKDDENLVYTSEVADVDGQLLVCESTTDSNGNTLRYYFNGDVLVRSETVSPDGSVSATKFSKITTEVSDTLFAIPSDYDYLNLEWLMKLASSSLGG